MTGWLIPIDEKSNRPKYVQIYDFIRDEILKGTLEKGLKLPSIRAMSDTLGVSKSTIESAYNQLVVEGYIESRIKSGYYVNALERYDISWFKNERTQPSAVVPKRQEMRTDGIEEESFPFNEWKKVTNRVLEYRTHDLLTYGDGQGEYALRQEIAKFIHTTRGGVCTPEQIVVGAGIQYLFGLIATMFDAKSDEIAFEYPGFSKGLYIFQDYGYTTHRVPVYADGIDVKALEKLPVKMVYVSPSHQYPTGSVMPIQKRFHLLEWAAKNRSYVIEDDYDSLLRYEGHPVPALQGLSKGLGVIYVGSFSKLLTPALRISFMVLPDSLLGAYHAIKGRYSQSVSKIEQLTLAQFMQEGYFDKHIRRIRKHYARKNSLLVEAFKGYDSEAFTLVGKESGLHVVLAFKRGTDVEGLLAEARERGLTLEGADNYLDSGILVFPYSGIPDDAIEKSVETLVGIANRFSVNSH